MKTSGEVGGVVIENNDRSETKRSLTWNFKQRGQAFGPNGKAETKCR